MVSLSPYADMEDAQKQGFTWAEYFARGTVPLPQVALFERAWNLLVQVRTERADREGHPMDVDSDSGEVLDTPMESPEKSSQSPEKSSQSPEKSFQSIVDNTSRPSYYEVHPQAGYVQLDPDTDLPC